MTEDEMRYQLVGGRYDGAEVESGPQETHVYVRHLGSRPQMVALYRRSAENKYRFTFVKNVTEESLNTPSKGVK